jgi:hypothetical protein
MIMEATSLNPIQLHLLQMFSYKKDEESLNEMKNVLFNYYAEKAQKEIDRVWDEKGMSNELMEEWGNTHMRTPYEK